MWQLMYPFASLLAIFIIESLQLSCRSPSIIMPFAINYHAFRPFDLTIGPWVCHRDIFNLDACIFTELLELVGREI
jgi:hypothetical protein